MACVINLCFDVRLQKPDLSMNWMEISLDAVFESFLICSIQILTWLQILSWGKRVLPLPLIYLGGPKQQRHWRETPRTPTKSDCWCKEIVYCILGCSKIFADITKSPPNAFNLSELYRLMDAKGTAAGGLTGTYLNASTPVVVYLLLAKFTLSMKSSFIISSPFYLLSVNTEDGCCLFIFLRCNILSL